MTAPLMDATESPSLFTYEQVATSDISRSISVKMFLDFIIKPTSAVYYFRDDWINSNYRDLIIEPVNSIKKWQLRKECAISSHFYLWYFCISFPHHTSLSHVLKSRSNQDLSKHVIWIKVSHKDTHELITKTFLISHKNLMTNSCFILYWHPKEE